MQLDAVASQLVLENIRQNIPSTWPARARELRRVAESDPRITLKNFISETGIELEDIYSVTRRWSELLEAGGVPTLPGGPSEAALRRGLGRLLHNADALPIAQYRAFALAPVAPFIAALAVTIGRASHREKVWRS